MLAFEQASSIVQQALSTADRQLAHMTRMYFTRLRRPCSQWMQQFCTGCTRQFNTNNQTIILRILRLWVNDRCQTDSEIHSDLPLCPHSIWSVLNGQLHCCQIPTKIQHSLSAMYWTVPHTFQLKRVFTFKCSSSSVQVPKCSR
jgi:uncharacterized Zn-finger protein